MKKLHVTIDMDHININNSKKIIYFKNIKDLNFHTFKNNSITQKIIKGYELTIEDNNERIKFVTFTGASDKEKTNCESFLNFYNELNSRKNNRQ